MVQVHFLNFSGLPSPLLILSGKKKFSFTSNDDEKGFHYIYNLYLPFLLYMTPY